MTVSSTLTRANYNGNGVTTTFAVPFYFIESDHLVVTTIDNGFLPPVKATLAQGSDYNVSGAGNFSGGAIVLALAPTVTQVLTVNRVVPATQETHYVENDPFPADAHEMALDKLTMIDQQVTTQVNDIQATVNNLVLNSDATAVAAAVAAATNAQNSAATAVAASIYTAAGTGGVARSFQDRSADTVNVMDYMTTAQRADVRSNTGSIDVSGAWQAAIAYAQTIGALKVRAPAGTYRMNSAVTVFNSSLTIEGDGVEITKILVNNATGFLVWTAGAGGATDYVFTARDFSVIATATGANGTGLNVTYTAAPNSTAPASPDCVIERVSFRSSTYLAATVYFANCLRIANACNSRINDISITQIASPTTVGINLDYSNAAQAFRMTIDGLSCEGGQYGIRNTGWLENLQITNFEIAVPNFGIYIDASGAGVVPTPLVLIQNGHVNASNQAISINSKNSVQIDNVNVAVGASSTTTFPTIYGISLNNCTQALLTNNLINGGGGNTTATSATLIALINTKKATISGNVVDCNYTAGTTLTAVSILSSSANVIVSENVFVGNNAAYGIFAQPGLSANEELDLSRNRFENFATGILTTDVHDCTIRDNNFTGTGATIVATGTLYPGLVIKNNLPATPWAQIATGTTPSVAGMPDGLGILNYSSATTLTNFTGGYNAMEVTLLAANGNVTLASGSGLYLASNASFAMAALATITLVYNVALSAWFEKSRKP